MEYPADWLVKAEPKSTGQPWHEDFYVRTVDYKEQGFLLVKGASFLVRVENTSEESISGVFNKSLGYQIAKNKTGAAVDGEESIQYDYSYEGTTATMTGFLKNGKHYTINKGM